MQAEPMDAIDDGRPLLVKKVFALARGELRACVLAHEHAETTTLFHQILIHQQLIGLEHGQRVDLVVTRDLAHGGQGVALAERAVEHHADHPLLELQINRFVTVPVGVHGCLTQLCNIVLRPLSAPRAKSVWMAYVIEYIGLKLLLYRTITPFSKKSNKHHSACMGRVTTTRAVALSAVPDALRPDTSVSRALFVSSFRALETARRRSARSFRATSRSSSVLARRLRASCSVSSADRMRVVASWSWKTRANWRRLVSRASRTA